MGIDVEVDRSAAGAVVRVQGEVDLATAPELDEVLAAIDASDGPVVVDLSEVSFLDSSGLSVLVRSHQHLRSSGGEGLRLVVTRPATQRVLDATGLSEVFEVFASRAEATGGR